MSTSYVIQWKSKANGRAGRGTKLLERAEAERLAAELNREYPDIEHEAVEQGAGESPPTPAPEAPPAGDAAQNEAGQSADVSTPAFSSR